MWIDGTHMEDGSGYSNWACGEPNNFIGTEDCVEIDRGLIPSQRWKAIPCEGTFFFSYMCQKISSNYDATGICWNKIPSPTPF